jgi:hypothetical protein
MYHSKEWSTIAAGGETLYSLVQTNGNGAKQEQFLGSLQRENTSSCEVPLHRRMKSRGCSFRENSVHVIRFQFELYIMT